MRRRQRLTPDLRRSGGFVGIGGLACVLFLILASASTFPGRGLAALLVGWLLLLLLAIRWFTSRPRRVLLLPVVGVLAWVGAVALVARS